MCVSRLCFLTVKTCARIDCSWMCISETNTEKRVEGSRGERQTWSDRAFLTRSFLMFIDAFLYLASVTFWSALNFAWAAATPGFAGGAAGALKEASMEEPGHMKVTCWGRGGGGCMFPRHELCEDLGEHTGNNENNTFLLLAVPLFFLLFVLFVQRRVLEGRKVIILVVVHLLPLLKEPVQDVFLLRVMAPHNAQHGRSKEHHKRKGEQERAHFHL